MLFNRTFLSYIPIFGKSFDDSKFIYKTFVDSEKIMCKILFIILLYASIALAKKDTSSCQQSELQNMINNANPNDTIFVRKGTAIWTYTGKAGFQGQASAIVMNRGITLVGGMVDGTTTIICIGSFPYGAIQYFPNTSAWANNDKFEIC